MLLKSTNRDHIVLPVLSCIANWQHFLNKHSQPYPSHTHTHTRTRTHTHTHTHTHTNKSLGRLLTHVCAGMDHVVLPLQLKIANWQHF